MKLLKQGLALAVVGAGLVTAPLLPVQAQPTGPDSLVAKIKDEARGSVAATRSDATGRIGFLAVEGRNADLMPGVEAQSRRAAVSKAEAYLDKYAAAFGARAAELQQERVSADKLGTTVTYTQRYRGVEVFGSTLKVNLDAEGDLTAVSGFAAPGLDLSVTPRHSARDIGKVAVGWVKADPPGRSEGKGKADTSGIRAVDPTLVVYRKGLTKGEPGEAVLAYRVEVTNGANIRDVLFFDANTKKILNRWSMVHDALDRELHELSPDSTPVWKEGDPFPGTLNADQQNLVNSAGESYWLYANAFGRDSYDGAGAKMRTVNNDPTIDCPNANWNGITTNYCDGVTSDDVVSHEWGHAYTEYTSGLIYQYQSGALNESYSDVWGETLDIINGREDEDETFETKRSMACESTSPAAIEMSITAPAAVAGECNAVEAAFGDGFSTTPVTPDVVVAVDPADTAGPSTTDGCTAYTNAADVAGNYAYVDRGSCTFQAKVSLAEAAGATGIVVGNNNVDFPSGMSGTASIPGVMVSQADGVRFKTAGTATVSIAAEDTSDREVSTRWMMGEKSTAFGGAIRDMWMPTCQGDPGKVSDAEYKCDPTMSDSGGVHSNSGVPNHAYALTVDGGDYNGQSIEGIGIDKAANIWWRAQSAYLTPASNFVDAADALEQSCTDLTGAPINVLSTEADAGAVPADPIAAADCAQLAKAITAVEMRMDPARCDFQPILDPNAPSLCGTGWTTDVLWSEDFEDGLADWTAQQELANWTDWDEYGDYRGGFGMPWESVSDAPGEHDSKVAYGPAPTGVGSCTGNGVNDFSSRDSIISPAVELPATMTSPRLTFEHYVATEGGYDGGNVKASVNGGAFEVIPASAYLFNAPSQIATTGQGNTNPLAGQAGFTGVDEGQAKGSWGESQIDVAALGAEAGDTVQFRFDIGRDGCGGVDGWYVDNIELVHCALPVTVTATHRPEPSVFGQPSSVVVEVARDGSEGSDPTGDVTLTDAAGDTVGEAELDRGQATIALPADLPVGVHTMTVDYSGSESLASASTDVTVTVRAADGPTPTATPTPTTTPTPTPSPTPTTAPDPVDSDTVAKVKPKAPKFRKDFKVKTRVRADGTTPTGKVVIKIDGKRVGSGMLENGKLKIKVKADFRPGKHKLVVVYRGSDTVEGSRDKVTFRIRR